MRVCFFVSLCSWRRCIYILSTVGLLRDCPCVRLFEVQTQTCLKGELRNSSRFFVSFSLLPYPQLPLEFSSAYRF